jgi:GNAT superfamily N-acetyltransferase
VWDANLLRVDRLPRLAPARAIQAEAEDVLGAAGLAHRRVLCDDEALAARLGPGLSQLGWRTEVHVVMAWEGGTPPPAPRLEWPEPEALRPAYATSHRESGTPADAITQLVDHGVTDPEVPGVRVRRAAIREDGEWAAMLRLYDDGATAELDDVSTLSRFRGRGLATELMYGAIGQALADGCDLVFLRADERDWPAAWYRRLGFTPVGRQFVYSRS